ncbi:MAG: nucleoside-diphosphate kinase [Candidatus Aenigmarchaeota archaeon ex4484_52]|nr:MAG: nucleoside-diphosphate kinase [Candidatus Aenigmarchaeota archaeon ex4484_52]
MNMDETLVIIKPDAVQRCLIGKIINRFEEKGLKIIAMKMIFVEKHKADKHYEAHKGKDFFDGLIDFITSGPVCLLVLKAQDVINIVRNMIGDTDPKQAQPGTIRHDFGMHIGRNLIHASDCDESAKREINIFFKKEEIIEWKHSQYSWIYE